MKIDSFPKQDNKSERVEVGRATTIEHQEAERARDVKNIMSEHKVFFVHGILDRGTPAENSLLKSETSFETKIKVLLALDPVISTSTVKAGDKRNNMWKGQGVLIGGGRVLSASPRDSASVARSLTERNLPVTSDDKIKDDIKKAIEERPDGYVNSYNEFVVSEPKVIGLYVADQDPSRTEWDLLDAERLSEITKDTGLPIYYLEDGQAFETSFGERRGKKVLVKGKLVTPEQMAEKAATLTSEVRGKYREEIEKESPFRE